MGILLSLWLFLQMQALVLASYLLPVLDITRHLKGHQVGSWTKLTLGRKLSGSDELKNHSLSFWQTVTYETVTVTIQHILENLLCSPKFW